MTLQIYFAGSFFVYSLFLTSLLDSTPSPTTSHLSTWVVSLVLETTLVAYSLAFYTHTQYQSTVGHPENLKLRIYMSEWEAVEVTIDLLRIALMLAPVGFYLATSKEVARAGKPE